MSSSPASHQVRHVDGEHNASDITTTHTRTTRNADTVSRQDDVLLLLGDPAEDPKWLSPPLCLVRSQIEVFAATPADVADRTRHPPTVGQVGLRCIHCRPPLRRTNATCARGAVSFPKKIGLIHQTIRNFQRYHVLDCPDMPADVKEQLEAYADKKKQHQSRRDGAAAYWVDSFRSLGVRDVVNVAASDGAGAAGSRREEIRFVDGGDGAPQRVAFDDGGTSAGETGEVDMEAIRARRVYVPVPNHHHNRVTPPTLQDSIPRHADEEPSSSSEVIAPQESAPTHTCMEASSISLGAIPQNDDNRNIDDDVDDADFLADIDGADFLADIDDADFLFEDDTVMNSGGTKAQPKMSNHPNPMMQTYDNTTSSSPFPGVTSVSAGSSVTLDGFTGRHVSHHEDAVLEDEPQTPIDQQPRFTEQDDKHERASLSIAEIVKIQSDLIGVDRITSGLSGLGLNAEAQNANGSASTTSLSPQQYDLLMALETELAKIPAQKKAAYSQAIMRCPGEVNERKRLAFLEHEEGNASRAAQRLVRYWDFRLELFGEDRCYLPMSLVGAMEDEMLNLAERKVWQLLPNTDAAGRGIIYFCIANRDLSQYSAKQETRALFYFAHCLMEDDRTRRKGYVGISDGRNTCRRHYSMKFARYMNLLEAALPIRMRAIHSCHPSKVMYYIIDPVFKRILNKEYRLRIKLHHGSTEEVLRSLAEYRLPPERVHADLGGGASVDMNQFLMERMKIEAASLGLDFPSSIDDRMDVAPEDNVRDNKRPRQENTNISISMPEMSKSPAISNQMQPSEIVAATAVSKKGLSSSGKRQPQKRTGPRNVVDPRMARAVATKKEDPKISLYDALIAGGFIFTNSTPGCKASDDFMIDQDGVSLKQRKNNLLRRLRIEKQKDTESRTGANKK